MINTPAVCAAQNPGKMVLLDADGITGAEGEAVISRKELMTDPDVLRAFIDYGVANYPAEKYDLILWDHGGGTTGGFGSDEHAGAVNKEFVIVSAEEELPETYLDEAQDWIGKAENFFDPGNPYKVRQLFNAQNALADALNALIVSKDKLPAAGKQEIDGIWYYFSENGPLRK